MLYLWNVRFCILFIMQMVTSMALICHEKKRTSYFTEVALSFLALAYGYYIVPIITEKTTLKVLEYIYANYSFTKDKCVLFIIEYVVFKFAFVVLVWILKYYSFYAIVSNNKNPKGIIAKIGCKVFGKKRFERFISRMWNRVDYGIRIKKGMPERSGKKHAETGIAFDKNGFPEFKEIVKVKLSRKLYNKSREVHFYYCNKKLAKILKKQKGLAKKFTKSEIESFERGDNPPKYTWHHHQDKGVLQLVDSKIHAKVKHRGGFSIWGKRDR